MKKVAFMIVYNDEDYIEYSINAIKDLVDELVIVEGAFGVAIEKCGASPRSLDKTIEKIKKYADNNKVFHREGNGWAHKEQYQIAFDFAKERSADWAILVDSDEIWSPSLMKVFDAKVKTADKLGVYQYRLNTRNFVNDFNTWYPGQSPRIYRMMRNSLPTMKLFGNPTINTQIEVGQKTIFTSCAEKDFSIMVMLGVKTVGNSSKTICIKKIIIR
jgi:glycosyltransferase involved in cell wall biosynthesis